MLSSVRYFTLIVWEAQKSHNLVRFTSSGSGDFLEGDFLHHTEFRNSLRRILSSLQVSLLEGRGDITVGRERRHHCWEGERILSAFCIHVLHVHQEQNTCMISWIAFKAAFVVHIYYYITSNSDQSAKTWHFAGAVKYTVQCLVV